MWDTWVKDMGPWFYLANILFIPQFAWRNVHILLKLKNAWNQTSENMWWATAVVIWNLSWWPKHPNSSHISNNPAVIAFAKNKLRIYYLLKLWNNFLLKLNGNNDGIAVQLPYVKAVWWQLSYFCSFSYICLSDICLPLPPSTNISHITS